MRPLRVRPCQKSASRCPTPTVAFCLKTVSNSKGLEEWQRGEQRTSDENGPLPVPKFARVISGRRHHRLPILVSHLVCRVGKLQESLLKQRAARAIKSSSRCRQVPQVCKGARAPPGRGRRSQRCPSCVSERLLCPGYTTRLCCSQFTKQKDVPEQRSAMGQSSWTRAVCNGSASSCPS